MAKTASEPTLRDVYKVVSDLVSKVSSLEAIIINQNEIINLQAQDIKSLSIAVNEGNSQINAPTPAAVASSEPTPTPPPPPMATQRPVRQARVKAAAAFTTNAPKKGHTEATQKSVGKSRPSLSNQMKTPNVTRPNPVGTPTNKPTVTKASPPCVATQSMVQSASNSRSAEETQETGWQKVTKKMYNKRRIITGTAINDNDLKTVERLRYIQAWQFDPDTTSDNIVNYLNKIIKSDKYFVERRQTKSDWHAVFVIGFPESLYEKISSPTSWPTGVRVSHWNFRSRASVGSGSQ